jgi:pyruvate dehydrogenase complex dihydrolipoamide acetyltransferase long form
MEVEAVDEGKLGQILVEEGTEGVKVNAVIAVLLEEGETEAAKPAAPAAAPAPKAEQKPAEKPAEKPAAPAPKPAAPAASTGGARIFASPLAKRIAAEKGIDLGGIKGSGPNGRIVRADVENAKPGAAPAAAQAPKAAVKAPAPPAGGQPVFVAPGDSRVPHTSIRKVIARRMLESKQTVPHFYLTVDFEIDALLTARTAINAVVEKKGTKVSVNDMVIKACAKALRDHPECNASWTEEEMIQYGAVDISVAVATDRGLITPIVRNADMKGLAQISIEMKDLASRAKRRQAEAGGVPGRRLHHLEPRHVRRPRLRRHHQPPQAMHPGRRRGRRAGGRAQGRDGRPQHHELHAGGRSPRGGRRYGRAIPADAQGVHRTTRRDAGLGARHGRNTVSISSSWAAGPAAMSPRSAPRSSA